MSGGSTYLVFCELWGIFGWQSIAKEGKSVEMGEWKGDCIFVLFCLCLLLALLDYLLITYRILFVLSFSLVCLFLLLKQLFNKRGSLLRQASNAVYFFRSSLLCFSFAFWKGVCTFQSSCS